MGLFEKLFPKKGTEFVGSSYWKTLTAYSPVYSTRSGNAFESELVRSAIDSHARHNSKLNVVFIGNGKPYTVTKLTKNPNEWHTWSQELYRITTILLMQNTCFIVPIFDEFGRIEGIYPLLPSNCALVDYKGEPWLRYKFRSGDTAAIELSSCGVLTRFQYEDDFFGGSRTALNNTLDLIDLQNKGIKEAIKNGSTYRFMAKLSNFALAEDLTDERKNFNKLNFESEDGGGMLLFPSTYQDIKQINSSAYVVDDRQMNLIRTNVFNYFGVNDNVLQNKASSVELDAFFNGAIEPFAIQLSDVLTKMIFTDREIANGSRIHIAANRLQYMSTNEKVEMVRQLGDRGMLLIDEGRELFNLPPLPDGAGQHVPIRGEYYMADEEKEVDSNAN